MIAAAVLLFLAAALAGALNSVAGGGSFLSFPALLFTGVAPVAANATNTIALWPAGIASAIAYRREMVSSRRELLAALGIASLAGGLAGSLLLLRTSNTTFALLVPWLLLFATLLFTFGRAIGRRVARGHMPPALAFVAQLAIGFYGGYFGGGMGIMMLAVLSLLGMTAIHEMNSLKVVLGALINGVAVAAFVVAGAVVWGPALVMIVGGIAGGYAGAAIARRVKPEYVRAFVLAVAWCMTCYFFVRTYGS